MALLEIETIPMCQTIFLYNEYFKINIFAYDGLFIKHEYSFLLVNNSLSLIFLQQIINTFKRIV